jgi:hypothetical protein
MQEAQNASNQVTPVKFNIDIALELLASHLKETMEVKKSKYRPFLSIKSCSSAQSSKFKLPY